VPFEAKSKSKKLEWDGFCVTLRAGSGNRTALRPLHPSEPRVISVREAARLHSYPDWFNFSERIIHALHRNRKFSASITSYAVGMEVRKHLECHTSDSSTQSLKVSLFNMQSADAGCLVARQPLQQICLQHSVFCAQEREVVRIQYPKRGKLLGFDDLLQLRSILCWQ
jgi:C-5 cytosine-specific DNA methylase